MEDHFEIPGEDEIYSMYNDIQQRKDFRFRERVTAENPNEFPTRQAPLSNIPRNSFASFRSDFFNIGEGIQSLAPGQTKILAHITIPSQYSGVLTGFSQYFADCLDNPEVVNGVKWGLRINGLPPKGLTDFVGEFSTLMIPHSVYFPLIGGASTLGDVFTSQGGVVLEEADIPTVIFQATNLLNVSVILQGRLEGYMFPLAERNDEFSNI